MVNPGGTGKPSPHRLREVAVDGDEGDDRHAEEVDLGDAPDEAEGGPREG